MPLENALSDPSVVTIRHSLITGISLMVAASAVAALAVVATMTEADALSTVALGLAVLAFAAQLVVTMAQSQASLAQTRDTASINAETRAVLAELQAQGNALVSLQSGQFERLLDRVLSPEVIGAALNKSTEENEGEYGEEVAGSIDPVAFAAELRLLIEQSKQGDQPALKFFPTTRSSDVEDGRQAVRTFDGLSSAAQDLLMEVIDGLQRYKTVSIGETSKREEQFKELEQAGFLDLSKRRSDGSRLVEPTRMGLLLQEIGDVSNPLSWARPLRNSLNRTHKARKAAKQPSGSGELVD